MAKAAAKTREETPTLGDNSGFNKAAAARLKSGIDRIENLEEERKTLAEDKKEVFEEMKSQGFDLKIVRLVLAIRKKEPETLKDDIDRTNLYLRALGMPELDFELEAEGL